MDEKNNYAVLLGQYLEELQTAFSNYVLALRHSEPEVQAEIQRRADVLFFWFVQTNLKFFMIEGKLNTSSAELEKVKRLAAELEKKIDVAVMAEYIIVLGNIYVLNVSPDLLIKPDKQLEKLGV